MSWASNPWAHLAAGLFIWWAVLRLARFWEAADRAAWIMEWEWRNRMIIERFRKAARAMVVAAQGMGVSVEDARRAVGQFARAWRGVDR